MPGALVARAPSLALPVRRSRPKLMSHGTRRAVGLSRSLRTASSVFRVRLLRQIRRGRCHRRWRCRSAGLAALSQEAQARELLVERAARDAQADRRALHVLVLGLVDALDVPA